jgi:hypothetical protein
MPETQEVAVTTAVNGIVPLDQGVPDHFKGYDGPTGAEGLTNDDMTIPRVELAQGLTPAVKEGKVKDGDLFLNISQETLAEKGAPLVIVPLVRYKEYILWKDRADDGGGLLARATAVKVDGATKYAWDQPNTTFKNKIGGKMAVEWTTGTYVDDEDHNLKVWGSSIPGDESSAPAATETHNYIVVLPEHGNMVAAISLSVTQLPRARDFNSMLGLVPTAPDGSPIPIWGRAFIMNSEDDSRKAGEFNNVRFRPYGLCDEITTARNKDLVDRFAGMNVNFDKSTQPPVSGGDDL